MTPSMIPQMGMMGMMMPGGQTSAQMLQQQQQQQQQQLARMQQIQMFQQAQVDAGQQQQQQHHHQQPGHAPALVGGVKQRQSSPTAVKEPPKKKTKKKQPNKKATAAAGPPNPAAPPPHFPLPGPRPQNAHERQAQLQAQVLVNAASAHLVPHQVQSVPGNLPQEFVRPLPEESAKVDGMNRITARALAIARYKARHEYMEEVFSPVSIGKSRRIASFLWTDSPLCDVTAERRANAQPIRYIADLPKPPNPYDHLDVAGLEAEVVSMIISTPSRICQTNVPLSFQAKLEKANEEFEKSMPSTPKSMKDHLEGVSKGVVAR